MKYYTSYEKNINQTPKEKKQEYWKTAIGLQEVDQLKPSKYLLELSKKNIEEKLSNQEIEKLLYSHYTNKSKEEEIERKWNAISSTKWRIRKIRKLLHDHRYIPI